MYTPALCTHPYTCTCTCRCTIHVHVVLLWSRIMRSKHWWYRPCGGLHIGVESVYGTESYAYSDIEWVLSVLVDISSWLGLDVLRLDANCFAPVVCWGCWNLDDPLPSCTHTQHMHTHNTHTHKHTHTHTHTHTPHSLLGPWLLNWTRWRQPRVQEAGIHCSGTKELLCSSQARCLLQKWRKEEKLVIHVTRGRGITSRHHWYW